MSNTTSESLLAEPALDGSVVEVGTCACCNGRYPVPELAKVKRGRYDLSNRDGENFDMLCPSCVERHTTLCTDCGERAYISQTRSVRGEGRICEGCRYSSRYRTCSGCNECDHTENMTEQLGYYYCPSCLVQHANFDHGDFRDDGRTDKLRSNRCFGVEIETDECDGYYEALADHPAWGAKEDCTVDGKEFYSAILKGDTGLEAIDEITDVADSNRWRAGGNCGLHLHLDMRNEKRDSLYAIAYAYRATEKVWLSFVTTNRRGGSYCHTCEWTCDDVDRAVSNRNGLGTRFGRWADNCGRYNWVNVQAYGCHKTIEIRLHDGTCDGEAVTNWIKAHTRFADWASKLGYEGVKKALSGLSTDEMFAFIVQEIWGEGDLTLYYGKKALSMSDSYLTTSVGRTPADTISF